MDFYIERKIVKRGKQRIKITDLEIEEIVELYNKTEADKIKECYKEILFEMLSEQYSEKFTDYFEKNHKEFLDELLEYCFINQQLIDDDGIEMVYEYEEDNKINMDKYYRDMLIEQPLDIFIEDLVNNYEKFTTSDLQGVVQARCMKTNEDENVILDEIYKKIKQGI